MYCYVWEFLVADKHRGTFEAAYGPDGDWVRLFRNDPSYLRSFLLRDHDNADHYLTMDYWLTRHAYLAFRERFRSELDELDARCAQWTSEERCVGDFEVADGSPEPREKKR
jgi:hypothetical protein